ncbi:MAG: GNAT family N-acetyltransferase [Planctomycetaceae bacterium]
MNPVVLPEGSRLERLQSRHPRKAFHCGEPRVNEWLATRPLQNQEKHLSVTKVLVNGAGAIIGYYTLATGQVDFSDLPAEIARKLPRRLLPIAVLAWLGVDRSCQGQGLGRVLLAQALRDCYDAGQTFAFVAVVLDCLNDAAKSFYLQWDFEELPGHPYRLYLSARRLEALMHQT